MYKRLSNMIFTDDKVGALTILLKFCKPDIFTNAMFNYFTNQQMETKAQAPSWI